MTYNSMRNFNGDASHCKRFGSQNALSVRYYLYFLHDSKFRHARNPLTELNRSRRPREPPFEAVQANGRGARPTCLLLSFFLFFLSTEAEINDTSFADTVRFGKTTWLSREAFRGGLTLENRRRRLRGDT